MKCWTSRTRSCSGTCLVRWSESELRMKESKTNIEDEMDNIGNLDADFQDFEDDEEGRRGSFGRFEV